MGSMPVRLLVVVVCIGLVLVLTRLVRRRFHYTVMEPNNEFAGFMYSMIGLVYGVYLAFTIIAVWEQFSVAEEVTTARRRISASCGATQRSCGLRTGPPSSSSCSATPTAWCTTSGRP